jgi:hypothetical protein
MMAKKDATIEVTNSIQRLLSAFPTIKHKIQKRLKPI